MPPYRTSLFLATFLFSLSLTLSIATIFAQESSETWLDPTQSPAVKKMRSFSYPEVNEEKASRNSFTNQTCFKKSVLVNNTKKHDGCWYTTQLGMLEKEGHYLLQPGEKIAGRIYSYSADAPTLHPTQNPNVFIQASPNHATGYGFFVTFRTVETAQMTKTIGLLGSVMLTYEKSGVRLKSESGSLIHTEHSYVWQSENARWMILMREGGSFVRVDMSTLAMSSVQLREKPRRGWIPGSASISNDGKYVAAAIHGESYSELYITDLSRCTGGATTELAAPASNCPTRTLKNVLTQHIPNYRSITLPKLHSNHMLSIYHADNSNQYTQYLLQAPNTKEATNIYMAMGDSFTSGEGAFHYEPQTDVQEKNLCHLSRKSYPYLLDMQFSLEAFNSVACSGARIDNITKRSQTRQTITDPAQFYTPGYKPQLQYIRDHDQKPNIITLSVGGNDIGFTDKIKHCVTRPSDCFDSYEDRLEIAQEIDKQQPRLQEMFKQVKTAVSPDAKIYIIGYPSVINDTSNECGINVRLSKKERKLANDITSYLNQTIKYVASKEHLPYIDIEDALVGSRLCETTSTDIAMHGITHGNDIGIGKYKFLGKEGFHPNEKGQQLIKNAIIGQIDDFTHDAPIIGTTPVPAPDHITQNTPQTGRSINKIINTQIASLKGASPDRNVALSIDGFEYSLRPNTTYTVTFDNNSKDSTEVSTDDRGDLTTTLDIPHTVTTDIFAIHIYGVDDNQEKIDLYQYLQPPSIASSNISPINPQASVSPSDTDIPIFTSQHTLALTDIFYPSLRALLNTTSTPKFLLNVSTTAHLGEQNYTNDDVPSYSEPKVLELTTNTAKSPDHKQISSSQTLYLILVYCIASVSIGIYILRVAIRKLK